MSPFVCKAIAAIPPMFIPGNAVITPPFDPKVVSTLPLEVNRMMPKPVGFPVKMVGIATPVMLIPAARIAPLV